MEKNKIKLKTKILNFLTFGYIHKKAKTISQGINEEIQVSTNIPINVDSFIEYLGGIDNIKSSSATITTLKIIFFKKDLIQKDDIKNIGAKGIILGETKLTIVFGDWAQELNVEILKRKR